MAALPCWLAIRSSLGKSWNMEQLCWFDLVFLVKLVLSWMFEVPICVSLDESSHVVPLWFLQRALHWFRRAPFTAMLALGWCFRIKISKGGPYVRPYCEVVGLKPSVYSESNGRWLVSLVLTFRNGVSYLSSEKLEVRCPASSCEGGVQTRQSQCSLKNKCWWKIRGPNLGVSQCYSVIQTYKRNWKEVNLERKDPAVFPVSQNSRMNQGGVCRGMILIVACLSFSCTLPSSLDRHLQHCTISVCSLFLPRKAALPFKLVKILSI